MRRIKEKRSARIVDRTASFILWNLQKHYVLKSGWLLWVFASCAYMMMRCTASLPMPNIYVVEYLYNSHVLFAIDRLLLHNERISLSDSAYSFTIYLYVSAVTSFLLFQFLIRILAGIQSIWTFIFVCGYSDLDINGFCKSTAKIILLLGQF